MKYQRVGLHVSAAGGAENAPENAKVVDAECFQFFSRSPRGGAAPKISEEQAKKFRESSEKYGYESYIHTPYYINFASKKKGLAEVATRIVREELERGSLLGVKYVVTHMGSERDWDESEHGKIPNAPLKQAAAQIKKIFEGGKKFSSTLLLEIAAGAGNVVGDTFEELAYLLEASGRDDVHVCLDTCHLFASGYDLRSKAAIDETMKSFKKTIGLERFKLTHMNDSKADLGGNKDRHEHMGKGKIGEGGLKAILAHPDFQKVNFILETKHDNYISDDLEFLKKYRRIK